MNVHTITMDPADAAAQLREVRRSLHRRADAEYESIAVGLEALAKGTPVLSLRETIRAGGFDERGRPCLAIARADRREVRCSWRQPAAWRDGPWLPRGTVFFDARSRRGRRGLDNLVVPVSLGSDLEPHDRWLANGAAMVPLIPASVRNAVRFRDRDVFILWEVERWQDVPEPDRDPYLLRHLGGDAYAVLAQWDLTELERLVMRGRRSN